MSPTTFVTMLSSALRRTATAATRASRTTAVTRPGYYSSLLAHRHVPIAHLPKAFSTTLPTAHLAKAFSTTSPKAEEAGGSPPPPPPKRGPSRFRTFLKYSAYVAGSTVVGVFVLTGCIFLHDAFTYNEERDIDIPVFAESTTHSKRARLDAEGDKIDDERIIQWYVLNL